MFYNENKPLEADSVKLIERRIRITEDQNEDLCDLEMRLNIPVSVLVRMALDVFLPRIDNANFTENGIRNGYLNNYKKH